MKLGPDCCHRERDSFPPALPGAFHLKCISRKMQLSAMHAAGERLPRSGHQVSFPSAKILPGCQRQNATLLSSSIEANTLLQLQQQLLELAQL